MAGQGGSKVADYKPRPAAGPGAMANRADLTDGRHAGVGQTAVTGAPTPPATGTGGDYGQRAELQGLLGSAPAAGRSQGGRAPSSSAAPAAGGAPGADQGVPEPTLPPLAIMPEGVTAAYTDADVQELEQMLPVLHLMAAQPDASDGVRELFNLAGEVVLNHQQASAPIPSPLGPAPELQGQGF